MLDFLNCPPRSHTCKCGRWRLNVVVSSTAFDRRQYVTAPSIAIDHNRCRQSNATEIYHSLIPSRSPRSNAINSVRMPSTTFEGIRMLLKSSNTRFLRMSPRSHAHKHRGRRQNVVDGIRRCATATDRGHSWWTASVWTNARPLIPSRLPHPNAIDGARMPSTPFNGIQGSSAYECVRRHQWELYINLTL